MVWVGWVGAGAVRSLVKNLKKEKLMLSRWTNSPLLLSTIKTGGEGDCLFHSIAHILRVWLAPQKVTMENVREELALSLIPQNIRAFIDGVREEHKTFLPSGAIDWNELKFHDDCESASKQAAALVARSGCTYQGTDKDIEAIVKSSFFTRESVGIVAFSVHGPGYTSIFPDANSREHYICIYCTGAHWQAVSILKSCRSVLFRDELLALRHLM